jgi:hypothetical protein
MDRQMKLIEKVVVEQRLPEKSMTVDNQILAILLFELGGLSRNITLDNRRVVPIRLFKSR